MIEETRQDSGKKRSRAGKVRRAAPALIVLGAAAVVVGLWLLLPDKEKGSAGSDPPPVNVKVVRLESIGEMPDAFELVGKVVPDRVVEVSAEVAGRIEEIPVSDGDEIRQGAVLIRLNTDLLQADHDHAKATAEFDQREYQRLVVLSRRGVATEAEVDQARARAAASMAMLESTKALLDRAVIRAPLSGRLDEVIPEVGMYVDKGKVVGRIVDMDPAKVSVDVPEREVPFLAVGQEEEVTAIGRSAPLTGKISYISELADESANTTRIEISVSNRPQVLRSGQIVRVRLRRGVVRSGFLVPLDVVVPLEQGKAVYVVNAEGTAERRNVEVDLGFIRGSQVRVEGDLAEGDLLIVSGHRFVAPGQPVKIIGGAPAGEPGTRPATRPAAQLPSPEVDG